MLFLHRRHEAGLGEARTSASGLIVATEHSGTHIDALCHQAEDGRLCDGTRVDATIQGPAGVTHLDAASIEPLRARGVLLDVPAVLDDGAPVPSLIGSDLLRRALEARGLDLRPGDAVLVRTGNGAHFHERARYEAGPGIAGEASAWLAARAPLLVGSDTMAWDLPGHRDPQLDCTLPGHVHLICRAAVHIVENLALEELAADGVGEFASSACRSRCAGRPARRCGRSPWPDPGPVRYPCPFLAQNASRTRVPRPKRSARGG